MRDFIANILYKIANLLEIFADWAQVYTDKRKGVSKNKSLENALYDIEKAFPDQYEHYYIPIIVKKAVNSIIDKATFEDEGDRPLYIKFKLVDKPSYKIVENNKIYIQTIVNKIHSKTNQILKSNLKLRLSLTNIKFNNSITWIEDSSKFLSHENKNTKERLEDELMYISLLSYESLPSLEVPETLNSCFKKFSKLEIANMHDQSNDIVVALMPESYFEFKDNSIFIKIDYSIVQSSDKQSSTKSVSQDTYSINLDDLNINNLAKL